MRPASCSVASGQYAQYTRVRDRMYTSRMSSSPAIRIKDLKKTYQLEQGGTTDALKGVSLDIPKGSFFSFLGPNGAGKTTTIGIVAGLTLKTAGTVEVMETSID